jgi:uncharacterized protein (TIGR03067 family)
MSSNARWVAPVLVAAFVSAFAARADDATPSGDLKKLQGAWSYTSGNGEENRWVFEKDVLKSMVNGQRYVSTVTLDPKAKPIPTIDFKVSEAPDDTAGKTIAGIYEINGDSFKVCISLPGIDTRPTEFKRVEDMAIVIELKRVKE